MRLSVSRPLTSSYRNSLSELGSGAKADSVNSLRTASMSTWSKRSPCLTTVPWCQPISRKLAFWYAQMGAVFHENATSSTLCRPSTVNAQSKVSRVASTPRPCPRRSPSKMLNSALLQKTRSLLERYYTAVSTPHVNSGLFSLLRL